MACPRTSGNKASHPPSRPGLDPSTCPSSLPLVEQRRGRRGVPIAVRYGLRWGPKQRLGRARGMQMGSVHEGYHRARNCFRPIPSSTDDPIAHFPLTWISVACFVYGPSTTNPHSTPSDLSHRPSQTDEPNPMRHTQSHLNSSSPNLHLHRHSRSHSHSHSRARRWVFVGLWRGR